MKSLPFRLSDMLGRTCVNVRFVIVLVIYVMVFDFLRFPCFWVIGYVNCRTYELIFLFGLNPLWDKHVFNPLIGSLPVLFWYFLSVVRLRAFCALFHRQVFRLRLRIVCSLTLVLYVDSFMFFSEHSRHCFDLLLLFWDTSYRLGCFAVSSIVNNWSKTLF